jgi:hypothetical protein
VTLHLVPSPIEIDSRPCELCGCTIDRHEMIDNGEGPEFFCIDYFPEELSLAELERRAEMRRQEEVAAIIARWETLGPPDIPPPREPEPYRPAKSTIDAFRFVAATGDVVRLKAWLADRPKDAPLLLALLESPASC